MKIFLAGIMQGSHVSAELHAQDYRPHLIDLLMRHLPHAEIYDPLADHGNSLDYDDDTGRSVFMHHNRMCAEIDLLIAFVPQASMGTAIEMWEAHRAGRKVVSVSPLDRNWAVRFLSDAVYPDLQAFEEALANGSLLKQVGLCSEEI